MRVRYLSGNAAGCEEDLPQIEAEAAIVTGYAELAPDAPTEDPPPADPPIEDLPPPDPQSE
jgi:hypothetical protein